MFSSKKSLRMYSPKYQPKYSESKHLEAKQRFKIVFIEGEKYQLRTGQPAVVER